MRHEGPSAPEPPARRRRGFVPALFLVAVAACLLVPLPAGAQTGGGQGTGGVRVIEDLEYRQVDGTSLRLDAYVPPSGSDHPGIVLIHGGGFIAGDKHLMRQSSLFFAQNGYSAFSIDYRLAPQFVYPAPVDDAKAAIEFVRANAEEFRLDPLRMGVFGTSAGGTIAFTVGAEGAGDSSWNVAAAAGWSAPAAFSEQYDTAGQGSGGLKQFVFGDATPPPEPAATERVREADPATKVTRDSAPTFVANSTNELVPLDLAQAYVQILDDQGVPNDYLEVPGSRHGTMIAFAARQPTLTFFDQYVRDYEPPSPSPSPAPSPTGSTGPDALGPPAGASRNWVPLGIVIGLGVGILLAMVLTPMIRSRRRNHWEA